MHNIEEVISDFRKKGFKITPQRRMIFEIILNNDTHPNVNDIYQQIKTNMPDISKTTVYNTLRELHQLGVIVIVHNAGEDMSRYDPKTENHHHLYCLACHRIIDIDMDIKNMELSEQASLGFKIIKKQITFYGYCPECQQKNVP